MKPITSVGHAAVDQLVHQVVIALCSGSLVVVEVGRDVIRSQLLQDLLLQGRLLVVAVGAVATTTVQNLNAVTQEVAVTAGHAVVVGMVTVKRERIHNTGVSCVVQDAL